MIVLNQQGARRAAERLVGNLPSLVAMALSWLVETITEN